MELSKQEQTAVATTAEQATQQGRRKFFSKAATAAVAAPIAGFPMISVAQSPIVFKMQGSWGANEIFSEMAQEYVTRVNEMAGGRLRIEYLPAGAVVKAFEIMDAVSKGVLDGGHHVCPAIGMANQRLHHSLARARLAEQRRRWGFHGFTKAAASNSGTSWLPNST